MTATKTFCWGIALLLLGGASSPAPASGNAKSPAPEERMLVEKGFGGFLTAHPDLRHHRRGMSAFAKGDFEAAAKQFRIAARYADKPSQAMLAQLVWEGQGVQRNRPLAYAWMDLAAERGNRRFLLQRERFWEAMDAEEQAEAIARGTELYTEFGDAVAQPRMAAVLRRASRNVVGSRTGYTGHGNVVAPAAGSGAAAVTVATPTTQSGFGGDSGFQASQSLPASTFYAPQYWSPKQYFDWRDQYHERQLQSGTVDVGGVRPAGSDPGSHD